jgi:hypothetical protein
MSIQSLQFVFGGAGDGQVVRGLVGGQDLAHCGRGWVHDFREFEFVLEVGGNGLDRGLGFGDRAVVYGGGVAVCAE